MTFLPPFAALRALDAVGRAGGIRKGGEALGISHAIVSRHLSSLEGRLGVLLLNRQTGELTEEGLAYHTRISAAIREIEAASLELRDRRARSLRIWCSSGFAFHWLTGRLPEFARGRNRPVIDLRAADTEPAFERNEADGDIRYRLDSIRNAGEPGVRVEVIARPNVFPVAAPGLLARLDVPIARADDLKSLPLIHENTAAEWISWFAAQGLGGDDLAPPVALYGQAHLTLAAARAGQGIALANHYLAAEDLAAGRLVRINPQAQPFRTAVLGAYIFRCTRSRWSDPMLARFRNWLGTTVDGDAE